MWHLSLSQFGISPSANFDSRKTHYKSDGGRWCSAAEPTLRIYGRTSSAPQWCSWLESRLGVLEKRVGVKPRDVTAASRKPSNQQHRLRSDLRKAGMLLVRELTIVGRTRGP